MLGLIGIILSLVLLMVLAYRGINVLVLAPLMALLAVLFAGGLPLMATYTQVFMASLGDYIIQYFPLFLLGAIFGKIMDDSGSARVIAHEIVRWMGSRHSLIAIVLASAILTYGGVSLFVVAFAVYPIGAALFRESDLPKRLLPAAIALGAFTFTMTALPGTPSIQNAIPAPFFGTTSFAAPGLGLIAGLIMFAGGVLWLEWRSRRAGAQGEGYGDHPDAGDEGAGAGEADARRFTLALAPIVAVIGFNYLFSEWLIPSWDAAYLAEESYGATDLDSVGGIWAIIIALTIGIGLAIVLNWRVFKDLKASVNQGTMGSLLPIFNTSSEVGYGATIASLPAFTIVRDAVLNIAPNNPIISIAVAVNVLAGITGSASGGLSIALETLGENFNRLGQQFGIAPGFMHRVAAISSGGFDALPHNGAVITLLSICGLTHRQSYADIGVVAVVIPVLSLVVIIVLGDTFGSF